jgi:hypothetical protein
VPKAQTRLRIAAAAAVIFAAYSAVVFLLPFAGGGAFWISYLCTALIFALALAASLRTAGRGPARFVFYRLPLLYVLWGAAGLQGAAAMIFMAAASLPLWASAVGGVVLLAFALAAWITAEWARWQIERLDRGGSETTLFMRSLQSEIEDLAARTENGPLRAELAPLAEDLRYSDPVSNPLLAAAEAELKIKIEEIRRAVTSGAGQETAAVCAKARQLLARRNQECRRLKSAGQS